MRASIMMASALVAAAVATPLQHQKRKLIVVPGETHTVTHVEVVTVVGQPPVVQSSPAAAPAVKEVSNDDAQGEQNGWGNGWGNGGGHQWGNGWGSGRPSWSQASQPAQTSYSAPVQTQQPEPQTTYQAPPPTSTEPAPASTSKAVQAAPSGYNDLVVYHHNLHRANHSSPDVDWSDDLYSSALEIAQSCVYAHNTEVQGGGYGQNIAAGVEPANISAIITDLFYNGEEPYFASEYGKDNPDMTNFEKWGHFSQVVWKGTTHVACATQHCPGGLANVGSGVSPYFTVCNYKTPGNYAGEYAANVAAPKGQPTVQWNYNSS